MREQLIEGSKGLYLQRTRSERQCVYSGETIPKGVHAASVRQEIDDSSYIAWIKIGSVDGVINTLANLEPEDRVVGEGLSPSNHIKYNEVGGSKQQCGICDEHMPKNTIGISFYSPAKHAPDTVWIHTECRDEVVDGLERVWDYSEELLPEQI